jgi:hypothetical protein
MRHPGPHQGVEFDRCIHAAIGGWPVAETGPGSYPVPPRRRLYSAREYVVKVPWMGYSSAE